MFFLARNATVDRVIEALKPYNPRVIQTNLSVDSERELIEALQGKNVGAEAAARRSSRAAKPLSLVNCLAGCGQCEARACPPTAPEIPRQREVLRR